MFNRREIWPNPSTNLEVILAEEIAAELRSRYEYTMEVRITHASSHEQLVTIETEINQFCQQLPEKSNTIQDKTLLEALRCHLNDIADRLRALIAKQTDIVAKHMVDQNIRENLATEFSADPKTQAAVERFLALFPGKETDLQLVVIGGKSVQELWDELARTDNVHRSGSGSLSKMFDSQEFTTTINMEPVLLVKFSVEDLGFTEIPSHEELYERAQEIGLELCPAEVGPHLCLISANQAKNGKLWIGMKPITYIKVFHDVFTLKYHEDAVLLDSSCDGSFYEGCELSNEWVFRLPV